MPHPPSVKSPASLIALSKELLVIIISSLDLSSALSLARTSRSFTAQTMQRIWRDVDLIDENDGSCYGYTSEGTSSAAERRKHAVALRAKIRGMISQNKW